MKYPREEVSSFVRCIISVSYTAAAGLTQTYVADSSSVEFSISDVAVLPNVEAAGNLTDGDELAAYGVSTCADNGVGGIAVSIAEPSQAGQEKTIIFTFTSENVEVEDHFIKVTASNGNGRDYNYTRRFKPQVNVESAVATFKNGVLDIVVKKLEEKKGKKVNIK